MRRRWYVDLASIAEEVAPVAHELLERARADRERAQRVRETRMLGRGKGKIRQPQLAQPAQALHDRKIEEPRLGAGELDKMVNRVENALHSSRDGIRGDTEELPS